MNGLERANEGRIEFYRLNVEEAENGRIQQAYGLRGHPSVVILDAQGQVVERYFGPETAEILQAVLSEVAQ